MYKILFVLFLSVMSVNVFSQTAESIENQANAMGIKSQEDILKELHKRGMTVEDARRMALINGINYDDYIKYKSELNCKENGKINLEGKDYVIDDGDIIHFKFNV